MVTGEMSKPVPRPRPAPAPALGIRVVLVDDSAVTRTALAVWLIVTFQVRIAGEAENGLDGFALAARLQPDLVITDFHMPGLDGFRLVERLRQEYPAIRSIITSAHDGPTFRAASRQHGADAFIAKERLPAELPRLLTRLFRNAVKFAGSTCRD
jgi:DNA-binding NarL/FixJ family response regulator